MTIQFDKIDGLYTESQRRIAEVIRDVFPDVRLMRLDPLHPDFNPDKPFALVHEPEFMPAYTIRNVHEREIDARLLAELMENNTRDPNSTISRLQILEMAQAAVRAKAEVEWREERNDILKSMMKSKKNTYTHDGKTLRK